LKFKTVEIIKIIKDIACQYDTKNILCAC